MTIQVADIDQKFQAAARDELTTLGDIRGTDLVQAFDKLDVKGQLQLVLAIRQLREGVTNPLEGSGATSGRALTHLHLDSMHRIVATTPADTLTPKQLEQRQLTLLNRYIQYARDNSPFWRERLPIELLGSMEDVREIPYTTKQDILDYHVAPFVSQLTSGKATSKIQTPMMTMPMAGLEPWRTSGTTSVPTQLLKTPEEYTIVSAVAARTLKKFFGPADRIINAFRPEGGWAGSVYIRSLLNGCGTTVGNLYGAGSLEEIAAEIKKSQYTAIAAGPSWLAKFISWTEHEKKTDVLQSVNKVLTVGEDPRKIVSRPDGPSVRLPDYLKLKGIQLINFYSGTEIRLCGFPLDQETATRLELHTIDDMSLIEFINKDGFPAQVGEEAELINTHWFSPAVSLFRYRSGDKMCLVSEPSSESTAPRVFKSLGRTDDTLMMGIENVYGAGEVVDKFAIRFRVCAQLVGSPGQAGSTTVTMHTEPTISKDHHAEAEAFLRSELLNLASNNDGLKRNIAGISIEFGSSITTGGTGKIRLVLNKHDL